MKTTEFQVGDVLRGGQYEIKRLLRCARDKNVYLAADRVLGFDVAIDVFYDSRSVMANGQTVGAWEAHVLGQLGSHPNIASAQGYWEENGMPVMATRYLTGGSLQDVVARSQDLGEPVPTERILRISTEIARGLEHIHGRDLLYRDLQPRNVLFDEFGTVHLVDFDTAVRLDDPEAKGVCGQPVIDYMAPELIAGNRGDERADLYSLGATMYAMITGHPPFTGIREEILAEHCRGTHPRLDRSDVSVVLRDLVLHLLAPQRDERPASATEVAERLESLTATRAAIEQLLSSDESATLEFKSVLRKPATNGEDAGTKPGTPQQGLPARKVLETVAAFHNSTGGTLVIGVADDKKVIGIEREYPRAKGRDGWRLAFDDLVSRHLGADAMNSIDLQLEPWDGRTIAIIRCAPRREPTWIGGELFVRRTASTEKLSSRDAVTWCREKWGW